jgi:iron complex outermembrane receptor protein
MAHSDVSKKIVAYFHYLSLLSIYLGLNSFTLRAQSQEGIIWGVVKDADNGETLPGVAILYGKSGLITDLNGRFVFKAPAGQHTLRFRFLGYETLTRTFTLAVGQQDTVTIFLKRSSRNLNLVVVSGSLYEKNVTQETVSMEVIDSRQIANTNSNDITEAVSRTSGILIQDNQISIRGGSSYAYGVGARTAVLVDGLSFSSADLGDIQSKMAPVENIRQIEVIKGASSVAYGSSAMNGVVNIITDWPGNDKGETTLSLNSGFYSNPPPGYFRWWEGAAPFFSNINVNHGRRWKQLSYVAGGNITQLRNYLQQADEFRVRGFFKTRYTDKKNPGIHYGLNGLVMHEASDRFFISRDMDSSLFMRAEGSNDKYWRFTLDPHFQYADARGHHARIYGRWMNIFRRGNGTDPNASSHFFAFDSRYQRRVWGERLVVSAGLPFSFSLNRSNLYPGTRIAYSAAGYLQTEGRPVRWLSLIGGVRYEFNKIDKYFSATDPIFRLGINMSAGKATFLRASWGQAYRLPTIGERFIQQEFTQSIFVFPNADLKTEKAWSAEIGFMQALNIGQWKALADVALFWQEYKNFVEYRVGLYPNKDEFGKPIFPNQGAYAFGLKPFNVDNARIAGYELTLKADGNVGPLRITLQGGYMYHWPGNLDSSHTGRKIGPFLKDATNNMFKMLTDEETINRMLFFRSRHLVRGDAEMEWRKFSLGGAFYYTSLPEKVPNLFILAMGVIDGGRNTLLTYMSKHQGGDWTFDLRTGYEITDRIRLGFIVKNVMNRVYCLRPGRPEPLRSATIQVRVKF